MDSELAELQALLQRQQHTLDEIKKKVDKLSEGPGHGFLGLAGGITMAALYSKLNDVEKMVRELRRR